MKARVTVVDYGRGNLFSIGRALTQVGAEVEISAEPRRIAAAERLLLPGVGSFGDGMAGLRERELVTPIRDFCSTGRPMLDICLGMQLLLDESTEFGLHEGLKIVPGRVVRFQPPAPDAPAYKIPQVGWNWLYPPGRRDWLTTPLEGLPKPTYMYFVHSYIAVPARPEDVLALTPYAGDSFCSVLGSRNILGCQFHPERSAAAGLRFLENWISMNTSCREVSLEASQ